MIKSHDEEALEFDEVDPDVVVLAQETRRPIQPPDVKDLRLKDAAGGGMNEDTNINYDNFHQSLKCY